MPAWRSVNKSADAGLHFCENFPLLPLLVLPLPFSHRHYSVARTYKRNLLLHYP